MSIKTTASNLGANTVTFSNITLQTGNQTTETGLVLTTAEEKIVRQLADIGVHSLKRFFPDPDVTLEVTPSSMTNYQFAVLRNKEQLAAHFHICFDAVSAADVWPMPQFINKQILNAVRPTLPPNIFEIYRVTMGPHPQLTVPQMPFIITSLLPPLVTAPRTAELLSDFAHYLFWALHERHSAR